MAAKLSDDTQVALPLRNILSIIAGVAIATWASESGMDNGFEALVTDFFIKITRN